MEARSEWQRVNLLAAKMIRKKCSGAVGNTILMLRQRTLILATNLKCCQHALIVWQLTYKTAKHSIGLLLSASNLIVNNMNAFNLHQKGMMLAITWLSHVWLQKLRVLVRWWRGLECLRLLTKSKSKQKGLSLLIKNLKVNVVNKLKERIGKKRWPKLIANRPWMAVLKMRIVSIKWSKSTRICTRNANSSSKALCLRRRKLDGWKVKRSWLKFLRRSRIFQ